MHIPLPPSSNVDVKVKWDNPRILPCIVHGYVTAQTNCHHKLPQSFPLISHSYARLLPKADNQDPAIRELRLKIKSSLLTNLINIPQSEISYFFPH